MDHEETATVLYLIRRKYWQTARLRCEAALRRARPVDAPVLGFWRAVASILLGKFNEAVRELTPLVSDPALAVAGPAALIHAHSRCTPLNRDAISDLEATLALAEGSSSLTETAYFMHIVFLGIVNVATDETDKWLSTARARFPGGASAATLITLAEGWLQLFHSSPPLIDNPNGDDDSAPSDSWSNAGSSGSPRGMRASGSKAFTGASQDSVATQNSSGDALGASGAQWLRSPPASTATMADGTDESPFDEVVAIDPKNPGALIGRILATKEIRRQPDQARVHASALVAARPRCVPALIEGMHCALATGAWDAVTDACHRILTLAGASPSGTGGSAQSPIPTVDALVVLALADLLRDGQADRGAQRLTQLLAVLRREEGENAALIASVVHLLTRIPLPGTPAAAAMSGTSTTVVRGGRGTTVLDDLATLAERMTTLAPTNVAYLCEYARVLLLQGKPKAALDQFQRATAANSHHVPALEGALEAELAVLQIDDSAGNAGARDREANLVRDLELLEVVQPVSSSAGRSPLAAYLAAAIQWRRHRDAAVRFAHLRDCVQRAFDAAAAAAGAGLQYLAALNVPLLVQVARDLVDVCPSRPLADEADDGAGAASGPDDVAAMGGHVPAAALLELGEFIAQVYPGSPETGTLLALAQFLDGQVESAKATIRGVMDRCPQHAPAAFLMAELAAHPGAWPDIAGLRETSLLTELPSSLVMGVTSLTGKSARPRWDPAKGSADALAALDAALAVNLDVRKYDQFHLLRARALRIRGDLDGAREALAPVSSGTRPKLTAPRDQFMYWVETLLTTTNAKELDNFMVQARRDVSFYPTLQGELMLLEAHLLLAGEKRGATHVDRALTLFRDAASTEPALTVISTRAQAHVHRIVRHDHRAAIRVCAALVDLQPGSLPAQLALADAYLARGDVDRAIDALTTALCYLPGGNPDSDTASSSAPAREAMAAQLTRKVAAVLVRNHEYARALEYLQDSVDAALAAGTRAADAILDQVVALAALHLKLGHLDQAEATAVAHLERVKADAPSAAQATAADLPLLEVLAQVSRQTRNAARAMDMLRRARTAAARQPAVQAAVCLQMAEIVREGGAAPGAGTSAQVEALLVQARELQPANTTVLLALAQHYVQAVAPAADGKADALAKAHALCAELLKVDANHGEGGRLMAQVLIQRRQFDQAVGFQKQILSQMRQKTGGGKRADRDRYAVLAQTIDLLHRLGRIDEARVELDLPEKEKEAKPTSTVSSTVPSGPQGGARRSEGYHFCLGLYHKNKNNIKDAVREFKKCRGDAYWRERSANQVLELMVFPDVTALGSQVDPAVVTAAVRVLEELPATSPERKVWEAYTYFGSRKRADIEHGLDVLTNSNLPDDLPAVQLARGIGQLLMSQPGKSKPYLKKLAAREWVLEDALHLETAWLVLAQIYLDAAKPDAAEALVKSTLDFYPGDGGRGAWCAWALRAAIADRQTQPATALAHLRRAWLAEGRSRAALGAHLAVLAVRAGRPTEAIRVARRVLDLVGAGAVEVGDDPAIAVPLLVAEGGKAPSTAAADASGAPMLVHMHRDVLVRARGMLRP
ncbi:Tetratricopeptide repeat protein 21B [Allomyces javanicus]|nr:Tetratricopeptide repeat protein 21B [Allomyces javanicus]